MNCKDATQFWRNVVVETTDFLQNDVVHLQIMRNVLFIVLIFVSQQLVHVQDKNDSFRLNPHYKSDTTKFSYAPVINPPHFKEWIVPSFLVAYGLLAIHVDAFTDLNENMQNLIWNKYPHNTVSIDNYLQFVPAAAVYGLNIAGIHGEHNFLDRSMIYILSNVIMNVTVFTIKNVSHEQRPNDDDYLSFPSGHTAEAFASAEFLMQEYKNVSVWYGIGGYAVAVCVAYLRMYNNEHWFSDVVAGAGIGIISTRLAYILYPKIKKYFPIRRFQIPC